MEGGTFDNESHYSNLIHMIKRSNYRCVKYPFKENFISLNLYRVAYPFKKNNHTSIHMVTYHLSYIHTSDKLTAWNKAVNLKITEKPLVCKERAVTKFIYFTLQKRLGIMLMYSPRLQWL